MRRSFPIVVATVLVSGAASAQARTINHPFVSAPAYTLSTAAQDDIAAKVTAAIKGNADLASVADAVTVTAAGNVVTLEGTVPSVQIRAKLAEFVMKVDGVGKLNNKLKLPKK